MDIYERNMRYVLAVTYAAIRECGSEKGRIREGTLFSSDYGHLTMVIHRLRISAG